MGIDWIAGLAAGPPAGACFVGGGFHGGSKFVTNENRTGFCSQTGGATACGLRSKACRCNAEFRHIEIRARAAHALGNS